MNALEMSSYIPKFINFWEFFILITLIFSFLFIFLGDNIYKKYNINGITRFIPFYNLILLLDIVKMPRIYFILLVLPILNIVTILIMLYRLGVIFNTSKKFTVGLVLLPVIFVPILNYRDVFKSLYSEENKKESTVVNNESQLVIDSINNPNEAPVMVSMLTQNEYNKLNEVETPQDKIDNIFKESVKEIPPVPAFKAQKNVVDNIFENAPMIDNIPIRVEEEREVLPELNSLDDITSTPKVDNVFKMEIEKIPPAPTFKAIKNVDNQINNVPTLKEEPPKIIKVEPVEVTPIKENKFIKDPNDEEEVIEIVEL